MIRGFLERLPEAWLGYAGPVGVSERTHKPNVKPHFPVMGVLSNGRKDLPDNISVPNAEVPLEKYSCLPLCIAFCKLLGRKRLFRMSDKVWLLVLIDDNLVNAPCFIHGLEFNLNVNHDATILRIDAESPSSIKYYYLALLEGCQ
jgi:hypothetical protein